MISQELLKTDVKLLLSANRKSHMSRRLAQQQRMTLSDLEWPFYASRAISAAAELVLQRHHKQTAILYILTPSTVH